MNKLKIAMTCLALMSLGGCGLFITNPPIDVPNRLGMAGFWMFIGGSGGLAVTVLGHWLFSLYRPRS